MTIPSHNAPPDRGSVHPADLVFNLVWTEGAFEYLGLFTISVLACDDVRFRFVANGCAPEELELMERFAERYPARVVDLLVVATEETLRHGDALDEVLQRRDDGRHFCFMDPDIMATGEFSSAFASLAVCNEAVTSGRELWSDDNVLPEGHPGLNGEYFFRSDGYVYGSPHFAVYDAAALAETVQRWNVGFGEGGNGLAPETRERLAAAGHGYLLYDTGKLVNILLQEDGGRLEHMEHPDLIHVGGLLHYLWAPRVTGDDGEQQVDWANWRGMSTRHEVARYTAAALRELLAGRPVPSIPDAASNEMTPRLERVRSEVTTLVDRFGDEWLEVVGRRPGPERAARTSYDAMRRMGPRRRTGR